MDKKDWTVLDLEDHSVHVVPNNDLKEHDLTALCSCRPSLEELDHKLIVHHAFDWREYNEPEAIIH